jgi:RNA polymerase sigma-B factor
MAYRNEASPALFAAAQAGDPVARDRLVRRFLPLARSLALRFNKRSEPLEDLFQVASLGLIHAIDRFEPGRGLAFSSFAVPTILGELRRHFRDRTWSVHMPRHLQERSARLNKVADELAPALGRRPTVAELVRATGMSEEEVLDGVLAAAAYQSDSLDRRLGTEDSDDVLSVLHGAPDGGYADIDARITLESAAEALLTRRQREVLWLRVDGELTQDEIARRVGISQMQVSRDLGAARDVLREVL